MADEGPGPIAVGALLLGMWAAAKLATKYPFTRAQSRRLLRSEFERQGKLRKFMKEAAARQTKQAAAGAAKQTKGS